MHRFAIAFLLLTMATASARGHGGHHGGYSGYNGKAVSEMFSTPHEGSPDSKRTESRDGIKKEKRFDGIPSTSVALPPQGYLSTE